jgi:hypothetical protein
MATEITMGMPLSFENLGAGAAEEKFEEGLRKVLANILDLNTNPKTAREIVLRVKIKPSEDRGDAEVIIVCDVKLAQDKPFPTTIFIGRNAQGKPEAHEINANQMQLFPKQQRPAVVNGGKGSSE